MTDLVTLCACGCGKPAPISRGTNRRRGYIAGQPTRFIRGHSHAILERRYVVDLASGCWLWSGWLDREGYGEVKRGARKVQAHRYVYERYRGPIPAGLVLDHVCHDPSLCTPGPACPHRRCVNPEHLEPVTQGENVRRSAATKLTAEVVREIRAAVQPDIAAFAERFGVSAGHVAKLRAGKGWAEVVRP